MHMAIDGGTKDAAATNKIQRPARFLMTIPFLAR